MHFYQNFFTKPPIFPFYWHTIVLGGKGKSEINPELGSVAQAVVRKAKCTVLVAR